MKNIMRGRLLILILILSACSQKQQIDLLVLNARIYTVAADSLAEAMAIHAGKFVAVGKSDILRQKYQARETIDAQGKPIYPGFYDAHCHFYNLGRSLDQVDLVGTSSYSEVLAKVKAFANSNPEKKWILGRGWDQNDWTIQDYPTKDSLDFLFPDLPIILTRVDGHAALVNQKALDLAGLKANLKVEGGSIILKDGKMTGVLVDNAINLVSKVIPEPSQAEQKQALLKAQDRCFSYGLTTLADAGSSRQTIEIIENLYASDSLKIRLYVMARPEDTAYIFQRGKVKTDRLNVRSFKLYADGALGSRGACLLKPYNDKPDERGFLLTSATDLLKLTTAFYKHGFQANTHCIGDSANRLVLNMYGELLKSTNDRRWRIEHAQVVSEVDIDNFGKYNIIPSVQPTHATSDMYWAEARLGAERVKTAYAFKDLLEQNNLIALGSDFPVEQVNPLLGFYAAVVRKDAEGYPAEGFQIENSLTRGEALKGMTIWAAYANFEDHERGSIEINKQADFVLLSEDIMTVPEADLLKIKVLKTVVGGEVVFSSN